MPTASPKKPAAKKKKSKPEKLPPIPVPAVPADDAPVPALTTAQVCTELMMQQRMRVQVMKSRITIENQRRVCVARFGGYHAGLEDAARKKMFNAADQTIEAIVNGADHPLAGIVLGGQYTLDAFRHQEDAYDKIMVRLAKMLPVAGWAESKDQAGFGLLSLARVVGECGSLSRTPDGDHPGYANPAKVWRRMGCAPWEFGGKTMMGSTWRFGKHGKLPAEQWQAYGYHPRRRSVAYLIGVNIKMSGTGPDRSIYRRRYEDAKAAAAEKHPEWTECECGGTGRTKNGKSECSGCMGKGKKMMRADRHGMLLATKLLLLNLWRNWNGLPNRSADPQDRDTP